MNPLNFLVGIATGIISGFGIGGGSLLVLYLTTIIGATQYTAGGINLIYFIGCAPIALIGHIQNKRIEWKTVVYCVVAGIAIAIPTSLLADGLDGNWLRRLFGLMLLYIGIKEWQAGKRTNDG